MAFSVYGSEIELRPRISLSRQRSQHTQRSCVVTATVRSERRSERMNDLKKLLGF